MSTYTVQEYANMHLIYGECRCNGSAAARLYRERYPNAARHPDHRVFANVHRLLSQGRFPNQVHAEGRRSDHYDDVVMEAVEEDPSISVRRIEARTGVPKSVAHRILKMSIPAGVKMPQSASAGGGARAGARRAGAGDGSERDPSRERASLHATPARVLRPHPKKQLFSASVSKFTTKASAPSPHLERIRTCLDAYTATPRPPKIKPKAVSMEDLTPTKRIRKEGIVQEASLARSANAGTVQKRAAARVARFMLVSAWRQRRYEIRYLRKTLEFQVGCSERLRMQVAALKSLLDSDTAKVRLAMRELERLKRLLRDKEAEKAVLEKEKTALEQDVCAAEDRASEMSIGWRNSRNEAENARIAAQRSDLRLHQTQNMLRQTEEELAQQKMVVRSAQAQAASLRRQLDERGDLLRRAGERLAKETEAREHVVRECSSLSALVAARECETGVLSEQLSALQGDAARLERELLHTQEQLAWWPASLTRMLGAARSWVRRPMSFPEAVMWSLIPSRHGC